MYFKEIYQTFTLFALDLHLLAENIAQCDFNRQLQMQLGLISFLRQIIA
jgi:hypothetical protein